MSALLLSDSQPNSLQLTDSEYPERVGIVYYVDFTLGNDANLGITTALPWKTITKINAETFYEGDSILFKRGETWPGVCLRVPHDGLSFGAYGVGANPIIDGQDAVECVQTVGKNNLRFEDIECTQGINSGFQFNSSSNIDLINCDAHDCGNDNLIFITGCKNCSVTGGKFYNAYQRVPTTLVTGIEIADGSEEIVIDGAESYGQLDSGVGISIHSHSDTEMPTGIEIKNCTFRNNTGIGINIWKQDDNDDAGDEIKIHDNIMIDNTEDGIRVHKAGPALNYPSGVKMYNNLIEGNTRYAYYISAIDSLIYRNRIDGRGFLTSCQSSKFVNNSSYFVIGLGLYPIYINGADTDNLEVKNNIVYATAAGGMMMGVDTVVVGAVDIDYNLYYLQAEGVGNTRWHWKGTSYNYANWLINSAMDANDPVVDEDPLWGDPPNFDFSLGAGSPAIDGGAVIPPITDGYLGTAPDCGYEERE